MAIVKGILGILVSLKKLDQNILKGKALQLGRQNSFVTEKQYFEISKQLNFIGLKDIDPKGEKIIDSYKIFNSLGFDEIHSMDNSEYENAEIIHDLNEQIPKNLENKYDFVFDGGTAEHVFNLPQVFKNIFSTLKVGGIIVHASPSHNFLEHGYYTFSPQLLYDYYNDNNYEIIQSYIFEFNRNHSIGPWLIREYIPGSLNKWSLSNWNGNQILGTWIAARKKKGDIF